MSQFSVSIVEIAERSMERKPLVITCTLTSHDQVIQTHELIACGGTGLAFMDQDFAHHHQVALQQLKA